MCSTSLSSGLLQSHVSSLSLPSVCSVSNTQVAVSKHHRFLSVLRTTRTKLCVGCLTGSSGFQLCLQPDLHSAFCQLSLLCTHAGTDTEPSPDLTARSEKIHRAAVALKRVGGVHHCLVLFSEPDLDDCRFPCQGNSPRESLSSQYASFLLSRKPVDAKFDMSAPPGPLEMSEQGGKVALAYEQESAHPLCFKEYLIFFPVTVRSLFRNNRQPQYSSIYDIR